MVVKGVAELSEELKAFIDGCFGEISRVASTLELAYHQVTIDIMNCTRPNTDDHSASFCAAVLSCFTYSQDT